MTPVPLVHQALFTTMEDKTLQGVNFGIVAVGDTAMKRVFLGNDSEVDVTYNIFSSTPHFLVLPLALGTHHSRRQVKRCVQGSNCVNPTSHPSLTPEQGLGVSEWEDTATVHSVTQNADALAREQYSEIAAQNHGFVSGLTYGSGLRPRVNTKLGQRLKDVIADAATTRATVQ